MTNTLKAIIAPLWIAVVVAVACMKKGAIEEIPHPAMTYTYLNEMELGDKDYFNLDIDANGTVDFTFSTRLVGDPVLKQDRLQFLIGSKIESNLLNSDNDDCPRLRKGDQIGTMHEGFNWYELSSILLTEKVNTMEGTNWWRGVWTDADHSFLPVQLSKGAKVYHGWIEVSFNRLKEKLVLHKAAISTEGNKQIRAGF